MAIETPKTGIYHGIPEDEYRAWHGLNATGMWYLKRSPAYYKLYLQNDVVIPANLGHPAWEFGSAMHSALFGNWDKYVPYDGVRRGAKWETFKAQQAEKHILSPGTYEQVSEMAKVARADNTFQRLLNLTTGTEVSALWESGVLCKGRADMLAPQIGTIIDYKTTTDASRTAIEKTIYNYGYVIQAAHYLEGFNSEGQVYEHFVFAVQEKYPPYLMAFYRLDDDALDFARKQIIWLKHLFSKCVTENNWPGYTDGIENIGLPTWAKSEAKNGNSNGSG